MRNLPFIKWMGGKRRLLPYIINRLPDAYNNYYEPFIGGGAVFFHLQGDMFLKPKQAYISDTNHSLISAYKVVQQQPDELVKELEKYKKSNSKKLFNKVKTEYNKLVLSGNSNDFDIAVRFIYLVQTCYGGTWRGNKKGEFDAVYSPELENKTISIFCKHKIKNCSKLLQRTIITEQEYHNIEPTKDDFVYLDPPYYNSDRGYNANKFSKDDHIKLHKSCKELDNKGVKWMQSNIADPFIIKLYKDHNQFIFKQKKNIRNPHIITKNFYRDELIITNY